MDNITDKIGAMQGSTGLTRAAEMLSRPDALIGGQEAAPASGQTGSFSNLLMEAIQGVQSAQNDAKVLQQAYQQGDPEVGLETTMVAMNKASLSFQMLAQARNRVISAYNEVMNMQV